MEYIDERRLTLPLGQLDRFVEKFIDIDVHFFFVFKSLEGGGVNLCLSFLLYMYHHE